jgi:site-specific DNA-methyltransferase (adenine-specific)
MKVADKIELSCMDNMQLMAKYQDKYFELAIVDLEYCIGVSKPTKKKSTIKQKNGTLLNVKQSNYEQKEWDFKKSSQEYLNELFRVSQKQIIFGGNYYGLSGGYLVWDKMNGDSDQYGVEMAWLSFTQRTDIVRYLWSGMFQGATIGTNAIECSKQIGDKSKNEKRIHPTQKPVALYKWILDKYAKQGDKILDTHLGSMSIAIACHDYNFELVGCELDEDYFKDGIKRVQNHISQQKIF